MKRVEGNSFVIALALFLLPLWYIPLILLILMRGGKMSFYSQPMLDPDAKAGIEVVIQ